MKALGSFVIVEPHQVKQTDSGLIIPNSTGSIAQYGLVKSAGKDAEPNQDDMVVYYDENTVAVPAQPGASHVHRVLHTDSVVAIVDPDHAAKLVPNVQVAGSTPAITVHRPARKIVT